VQVVLCLVGVLNLAFLSTVLLQSPLLYGQGGLQPVTAYLQLAAKQLLPNSSSHEK
jgi:uncharacterized membrane protein affecting hemolysin expression